MTVSWPGDDRKACFPTICSRPVFIIGSPRSGTSILAWSLAQHSALWTSDETDILFYLDRDASGHIDSVFQRAKEPIGRWFRTHDVTRAEFLGYLGLGLNALFTSRSEGKRWIDQTPSYTLIVDLLAEMFPDALFLHILRDGRRVVHSMLHFLESQDVKERKYTHELPGTWATNFSEACRTWAHFVERAMDFAARQPERCLTTTNERLSAEPESEFRKICTFLGIPYEEETANFFRTNRINSSFTSDPTAPPPPNPWNSWDLERKATFIDAAGPTLIKCGFASQEDLGIVMNNDYVMMISNIKTIVRSMLPPEATLIVVSRGDEELLNLDGRRAWHLPQDSDGCYAGYHPADGAEAISCLETLRSRGGDYLVIPRDSRWWLDHYHKFNCYLNENYDEYINNEHCTIYKLA